MQIVGLLGVKQNSSRLYAKGWRLFNGKPMWKWNVEKGLCLFDKMYVYTDSDKIIKECEEMGAIGIKEDKYSPNNITWYKKAFEKMGNPDIIVAIQVNSPTVKIQIIKDVISWISKGYDEVKTCHSDSSDYGSVWALTKKRLFNYEDPYHAKPDVWVMDNSTDIHDIYDLQLALDI